MNHLRNVFGFGWPYLRRHWTRLLAGVLLGVLFGLSNASFVWATKTIFERLSPEETAALAAQAVPQQPTPLPGAGFGARLKSSAQNLEKRVEKALDAWLPFRGRSLDWKQMLGGLLLLPLLVAFRGYVGYLSSYCLGWVSERVINDLRLDVLQKLNSLSLDFFNRSTTGDLLTRINGDTASLHRCLSLGFSDLIKEPITIICIVGYLCLLDWKLTLFALVFLPLCILPMRLLGKKIGRAARGSLDANVSQANLLVEMITGIRVVKAFGLERFQVERFQDLSRKLIHHGMKTVQARELVNPAIEVVSMIGLGALIVFIFSSGQTVAGVIGFLTGVITLYTPMKKLGSLHMLFQQTSVGVDRLMQVLAERPTVREPAQPKPFASFARAITLEQLGFAYADKPVLQGISLTIPRGSKLGIAGESGSGKSTLVNLLFRFYDPTQGCIKIDGVDLRELSVDTLRHTMALVSQEIVIFDLTAAENIALGKLGATRSEIEAAARAANAHEFISKMPQGFDTRLGERGVTLSGGQRQRIAIARAFIRNAPILVLDEATAALDSQSEAEVQAALERVAENRTVVSVAHRLSTLRAMDRIIVLAEGRLVEQGNFDELLRAGGRFAAMAGKQGLVADP